MKLKCPTCRHSHAIAKCGWCGTLFDPTLTFEGREKSAGRPRKYCSTPCQRAEHNRQKHKSRLKLAGRAS